MGKATNIGGRVGNLGLKHEGSGRDSKNRTTGRAHEASLANWSVRIVKLHLSFFISDVGLIRTTIEPG